MRKFKLLVSTVGTGQTQKISAFAKPSSNRMPAPIAKWLMCTLLMSSIACSQPAWVGWRLSGCRIQTLQSGTQRSAEPAVTTKLNLPEARMGNKAGKNKVTDEDMEFLMSHVEDKSLGGKSTFYRLNFTDSGHTKERIKVWTKILLFSVREAIIIQNR